MGRQEDARCVLFDILYLILLTIIDLTIDDVQQMKFDYLLSGGIVTVGGATTTEEGEIKEEKVEVKEECCGNICLLLRHIILNLLFAGEVKRPTSPTSVSVAQRFFSSQFFPGF